MFRTATEDGNQASPAAEPMMVHDYLEFWARASPDAVAVEDKSGPTTYAELDHAASSFAAGLHAVGLCQEDRFGVLARNRVEWLTAYYGGAKAGIVPVPLNHRLHPNEWAHILDDARVRLLVIEPDFVDGFATVRRRLSSLDKVAVLDEATAGDLAWDDLLAHGTIATGPAAPERTFCQIYTSGTTGQPKGALLSHRAVTAQIAQILTIMQVRRGDRALVVMPLFHAGGATTCFNYLAAGAHLLLRTQFDPAECVRYMDEGDVSVAAFVPAMIQSMLQDVADVAARRYEQLRAITYGASPISERTLRSAMEVFDCEFIQAYGMTESTAVLTMLLAEDHERALRGEPELLLSCGRPLVGTTVRIINGEGAEARTGEIGEIQARGPQLMDGYWCQEEATLAALQDGWLLTGDAGYLDENGHLYITDRIKDIVVSGGENISPREVEDVLVQLPEVLEAAVIGVPDKRWGEAVKAVIVVRPGHELDTARVIEWCRGNLASYKRPQSVDFVEDLPRNASGKVLKKELRTRYWSGRDRGVS